MLDRRHTLALILAQACTPAFAAEQDAARATAFAFSKPEGEPLPLSSYDGKPILIVNTATKCGFAPQFTGLQQLWTRFGERGLTVIAVPSPDFGNQEPLDGTAIAAAARNDFGVTFPVTAKTHVRGAAAHPFYRWAAEQKPAQTPQWNFHKYLVGKDGALRTAFPSGVEPTDPRVISAIVAELPQG